MSRGNRWTDGELALLLGLRDRRRLKWAEVSAAIPGRTASACTVAYYGLKHKVRLDAKRAEGRIVRKPAVVVRPAPPAPAPAPRILPAPSPGAISTFALREDAELRARIETLGVTGGLLGDPLPGRSALDMKRNGAALPARVTLATGRP